MGKRLMCLKDMSGAGSLRVPSFDILSGVGCCQLCL